MEKVMEISEAQVVKILQRIADAVDDSTADHVLMAVERLGSDGLSDSAVRSLLGAVADGLGVSLV